MLSFFELLIICIIFHTSRLHDVVNLFYVSLHDNFDIQRSLCFQLIWIGETQALKLFGCQCKFGYLTWSSININFNINLTAHVILLHNSLTSILQIIFYHMVNFKCMIWIKKFIKYSHQSFDTLLFDTFWWQK